jgi:uncharacterized protein YkwD
MLIAKLACCVAVLWAADGTTPAKPKDAAKPTQAAKPNDSSKSNQTSQPKQAAKPKETVKPQQAAKPKEAAKPQEAAKAKEPAKPNENDLFPVERAIIEQTNAERARYGLPPLEVDLELVKSARAHTIWMTTYQTLQHARQPVAENIAMGQRDQYEVLNTWMRSPGHRANILNGAFRRIGVAAYRVGEGTIFWCQQFR